MKSQFSGADKYFGHIFHNDVLFLVLLLRRDGTSGREDQEKEAEAKKKEEPQGEEGEQGDKFQAVPDCSNNCYVPQINFRSPDVFCLFFHHRH
jgi:hypothetical protein